MLEGLNNIQSRMNAIENRLSAGPQVDSAAFQAFMGQAQQQQQPAQSANKNLTAAQMLAAKSPFGMMAQPAANTRDVVPLAQSNGISCGQTSVAMSINALTGKDLRDTDINNKYGFGLLNALNGETSGSGYSWKDGGEVGANQWDLIDYKVNQEKTPVIVALNGPEFSPSGRGHIVTIVKTEGDNVTYADPATGTLKTTSKKNMNEAPRHPDGNFIFYAARDDGGAKVATR